MLTIPSANQSTDEASFLSQEFKRGQKRQAEDREMIGLDAFEQMYAITLELIGADARDHSGTGRLKVRFEEPVTERTHGHARNLHRFVQHLSIAHKRNARVQLMDEVIFEEFKGTGNSELILDRKVADKRTFPAMDITRSGTRKEELLTPPDQLKKMYVLRRILNPMGTMDAIDFLLDKLRNTKTNGEFFDSMNA